MQDFWFLLVPSIFVVPIGAAILRALRTRPSYAHIWMSAVVISGVLSAGFTLAVLSRPLYSERSHAPANPGGPSASIPEMLGGLVVVTCLILPSYPMLIALAIMPPVGWRRHRLIAMSLLYVGVLGALLAWRQSVYMADYQEERAKPRQTPFQRFEHLRQ
jgi:hypothetical protein